MSSPDSYVDLLAREDGVITHKVAQTAGVHRTRLVRLHNAGLLVRLAPGSYASSEVFATASPWARHRLHACALVRSRRLPTFLTGWSAAVTWRLPTIGSPPPRPQAVRSKDIRAAGEQSPFGTIRAVHIPMGQARRLGDVRLMSREWTVADIARSSPIPHALVVADAAARSGAPLHEAVQHMTGWAGVHRARWIAQHADPLAESPIETLGRFTCIQFNLPIPVSNAWVGAERPEFRVDGLWPHHGVVCEADGAVKYDNRPDASRIIARQTEREWRLRRLGLDLVRYDWDLANHDRTELGRRFAALLRDNPPRPHPVRWWKHDPDNGPVEPQPHDWPTPHPASITLPAGWDQ